MREGGMSLLAICPTWNRPHRIVNLIDSFIKTHSEGSELFVYVNDNDDRLGEYKKVLDELLDPCWTYVIDKRRWAGEVINKIVADNPGYDYYQELNDDHVYITPQWDRKLIEVIETKGRGWGLVCGDAKVSRTCKHPSAAIISSNCINTLGHFVWPGIRTFMGDVYLRDLYDAVKRSLYCPEVVIQHEHYTRGFHKDDVYGIARTRENTGHGRAVFKDWETNHKRHEIKKLRDAISKDTGRKWDDVG